MDIADLLTPDRIALDLRTRDKSHLITELSRLAAGPASVLPAVIEAALRAREQLGSTGLGAGFALPHARIEGLRQFQGLLVRLARSIDFEAVDGKPVDLLFLLLIPDGASDHVSALAAVARRLRDPTLTSRLRRAPSQVAAYELLTQH